MVVVVGVIETFEIFILDIYEYYFSAVFFSFGASWLHLVAIVFYVFTCRLQRLPNWECVF